MAKKIISIGTDFTQWFDEIVEAVPFISRESIQHADILLFSPNLYELVPERGRSDRFNAESSRKYIIAIKHWHEEIVTFLRAGKSIFLWFDHIEPFQIYIPDEYQEKVRETYLYELLPIDLSLVKQKSGDQIELINNDPLFRDYWDSAKKYSRFIAVFPEKELTRPIFRVRGAKTVVGGIIENEKGHIVLFPRFDPPSDYSERNSMGHAVLGELIKIDKHLTGQISNEPPPSWVADKEFISETENTLQSSLHNLESEMEILQRKHEELDTKLEMEQKVKRLLYSQGCDLEDAVREGLSVLGFKAQSFNDGTSEYDVLFEGPEGSFLGEIEGKDKAQIDVQKLRQLLSNIDTEMFSSISTKPRLGVLFGNGYRLKPVANREVQFTERCKQIAKQKSVSLVQTKDLFYVVNYVSCSNDENFAKSCREAILRGAGDIVKFPEIPESP